MHTPSKIKLFAPFAVILAGMLSCSSTASHVQPVAVGRDKMIEVVFFEKDQAAVVRYIYPTIGVPEHVKFKTETGCSVEFSITEKAANFSSSSAFSVVDFSFTFSGKHTLTCECMDQKVGETFMLFGDFIKEEGVFLMMKTHPVMPSETVDGGKKRDGRFVDEPVQEK